MVITSKEMCNIVNDRLGFQFCDLLGGDATGFIFTDEKEAEEYIDSFVNSINNLLLKMNVYTNFEEDEEEEYYYDDFGDEHSIWDYNDRPIYPKETRDYWHQAAQKGV